MDSKVEDALVEVWGQEHQVFHTAASQRQRRNKIEGLNDEGV